VVVAVVVGVLLVVLRFMLGWDQHLVLQEEKQLH
jgi:hypothetical protein